MRVLQSISPMILFFFACLILIFVGMASDLERFITPEKGLGYTLGIVGGSAMLLLLLYPARKRLRWLGPIGTIKAWFQIHMALGIFGPMLILFHANFRTGATNSNVALYCMLVVSGSGLFGRYFYSRIHSEFYGKQANLADLRERLDRLQQVSGTLSFVPDLAEQLKVVEAALLANFNSIPGLLRAPVVAWRAAVARRRIGKYIRRAARQHDPGRRAAPERMGREIKAAREVAFRHIDAVRRVAELSTYERLFSLWHVLHLPLFFMLLVAGTVHVIAVHVY
ncbi:MAG: hypothetical protein ABI616_11970 [Pseudomonadota bacterium]